MDQVRLVLGIVAAILHGTAFYLYSRHMKLGQSKPNIVTWSITVFLIMLNALTFREMVKDEIAILQFFVGATGCLIVFLYALAKGKFSQPGPTGRWAIFLGGLSAITWYVFREATWANMIVLIALFVALIPTWEGTFRDPFVEMPRSWAMWATAYLITTVNLLLNPGWQAMSLVNPILNIFAHGLVAVLSTERRKSQFHQFATR